MPSLKILREEIQKTETLREVMGTLEKVAGFERIQSHNFFKAIEGYENELTEFFEGVLPVKLEPAPSVKNAPILLLGFGPEKGLTGSFAERLAELLLAEAEKLRPQKILAIGKELAIALRVRKTSLPFEFLPASGKQHSSDALESIAERVTQGIERKEFSEIVLVAARYLTLGEYEPYSTQIFRFVPVVGTDVKDHQDYVFVEPSLEKILRRYLSLTLVARFARPWREVKMIEASLRLLETNRAKENARSMAGVLHLFYTRTLRGKITRSINEIFTGKAAFERKKRKDKVYFEFKV